MTYTSPTTPMKHQTEALRRIRERPRSPSPDDVFALLMEMGTGKSKVVVDEWQNRVAGGDVRDLLIVAPAGSYRNWTEDKSDEQPSELRAHLDPDLYDDALRATWQSGSPAALKRVGDLLRAKNGRPRVLAVNVEALSTVEAARTACGMFLRSGRAMMVVDESTVIKSYKAKRSKNTVDLGRMAAARRILTGMVAPRSPLDLFMQFNFLDWRIIGLRNFFAFRNRYAIVKKQDFGGRMVDIVVGFRNVQELQAKIAPYSYRVTKEECLDLEPKTYSVRDVPLTKEQVRMYKEMRDYATAEIAASGTFVTAQAVISQLLRLHQIVCGHTKDENGSVLDVPSNRVRAVVDLLDEHDGKAIIWTTYDHELRKLMHGIGEEFGPQSVVGFWGGNRKERAEGERRFLSDPNCRYMVATPAAGGRGNTWNVANLVIYAANSYDLELRSQSEDRCHRRGQTRKVTYVDLVSRGTVDERIIKALRKKIDIASMINGDNYREWLI